MAIIQVTHNLWLVGRMEFLFLLGFFGGGGYGLGYFVKYRNPPTNWRQGVNHE